MSVFPLNMLAQLRPEWASLHGAECMQLTPGQMLGPGRCDAARYYLVMEGELNLLRGAEEVLLEEGEVAAIAAGAPHRLTAGPNGSVVIVLSERLLPPFRSGFSAASAPATLLTAPSPLPSRRHGATLRFDETSTFSPHLIASSIGGDLALEVNLGAMVKSQAQEIRRSCEVGDRVIFALIVQLEPDEEPMQLLLDKHRMEILNQICPLHVGITADLSTAEGRERAERFRADWGRRLLRQGRRFIISTPWATPDDLAAYGFLDYLGRIPPEDVAVMVNLREMHLDFRDRQFLTAALPWIKSVACQGAEGFAELSHYLEGLSFQGWVLQRV